MLKAGERRAEAAEPLLEEDQHGSHPGQGRLTDWQQPPLSPLYVVSEQSAGTLYT